MLSEKDYDKFIEEGTNLNYWQPPCNKTKEEIICRMKLDNSKFMTHLDFFEAFEHGQRKFNNLDFENLEGFSNKDFSGVEFEGCFFALDFRNSNLTNSKFIGCNVKTTDFRQTNLTNALMKNCCIEGAMFKDAIIDNFQFVENYCFGSASGQEDFEKYFVHIGEDMKSKI